MTRPAARRTLALRTIGLGFALAQAVWVAACAAGAAATPVSAEKSAVPASAEALTALRGEIGQAPCTVDPQCHSIGIGARPCGGPEGYLAWSDRTARAERITTLAAAYADARKAENARSGIASDCRFVADPGAVCRPAAGTGAGFCRPGVSGRTGAV